MTVHSRSVMNEQAKRHFVTVCLRAAAESDMIDKQVYRTCVVSENGEVNQIQDTSRRGSEEFLGLPVGEFGRRVRFSLINMHPQKVIVLDVGSDGKKGPIIFLTPIKRSIWRCTNVCWTLYRPSKYSAGANGVLRHSIEKWSGHLALSVDKLAP